MQSGTSKFTLREACGINKAQQEERAPAERTRDDKGKGELDAAGTRCGRASGQCVCKSLCTIGRRTRELCHFALSGGR